MNMISLKKMQVMSSAKKSKNEGASERERNKKCQFFLCTFIEHISNENRKFSLTLYLMLFFSSSHLLFPLD